MATENKDAQNEVVDTETVMDAETGETEEVVSGEVLDTVTEEAPEAEDDTKDQDNKKKKSLFGKKDKKEKEKDKRDERIEELTEGLKRSMAEFDNYRKRTEKEKSAMYDLGAKSVVEKLLPIIDNFERGFQSVQDADRETDAFIGGMDLVYKQLMKTLEEMGVEAIETEGKEFDPNLHNAVMHIEDDKLGENMIAQEFQKGYTFKGTVVRHSMVQVAN